MRKFNYIQVEKTERSSSLNGKKYKTYYLKLIRGRDVDAKKLIRHISEVYRIDEPTTIRVMKAMEESLIYFLLDGRGVDLPYIGKITPSLDAHSAKSEKSLNRASIKGLKLKFYPLASIKRALRKAKYQIRATQ